VKPAGKSRTGVILIATRSPLWKAAREGPVPKTRLRQYFCRKSVSLFWMAGSLVMPAVPIKAGPFALPIQIRTGLRVLCASLSRYPSRSE
jgi:hypothetical protein